MLTVCSSKVALHPASNNFPIDMKVLREWPGSKCTSIVLSGNLSNSSVQNVLDGTLLPHADETKIVRPRLC